MVSHITYWDCRVLIFSEYLSRNSCICYSSLNIPLHYIPAPKNNPCAKKLHILLQINIYRNNPPKSHLHHWFPHKLTSEKWVQNSYTDVAYKKALWGALAAGREKGGELATTSLEFEFCLQFPCGSLSTELSWNLL